MNCQRNFPWYRGWQDSFRDQDVTILGIHTPETDEEFDVANVKRATVEAKFAFPVLIDNDKKNWDAWGNSMWPSVYLIDKRGNLRYWWYGELNWQGADGEPRMRQRIEELLKEKNAS